MEGRHVPSVSDDVEEEGEKIKTPASHTWIDGIALASSSSPFFLLLLSPLNSSTDR
jgi:hypothetical protein